MKLDEISFDTLSIVEYAELCQIVADMQEIETWLRDYDNRDARIFFDGADFHAHAMEYVDKRKGNGVTYQWANGNSPIDAIRKWKAKYIK